MDDLESLLNGKSVIEGYNESMFESYSEKAKGLKKVTREDQVIMYGLFKQHTKGDVSSTQPSVFDPIGRAKWDAYKKYEGVSQIAAGQAYCHYVSRLCGDEASAIKFVPSLPSQTPTQSTQSPISALSSTNAHSTPLSSEYNECHQLTNEDFPYDKSIHLLTPRPTDEQKLAVQELRNKIKTTQVYIQNETICSKFCTNEMLMRFLVGKSFKMKSALQLLNDALIWRIQRQVDTVEDNIIEWENIFSIESCTGKIYVPGKDQWGRPVVVFDNTVQNTKNVDRQMEFLAWNLNMACRMMNDDVDKYVVSFQ
jgi:diazepam-binding inhibitor (GABA receptor modulator, acyl-CoA-binding protein)